MISSWQSFCNQLTEIFSEAKKSDGGQPVNDDSNINFNNNNDDDKEKDEFAVSFCSIDGQRFSLGDSKTKFTVQASCQPISYLIALAEHGDDYVHQFVDLEPSGRNFNELCLTEENIPHNPMVNSGAIMVCSLIKNQRSQSKRFRHVIDHWDGLTGRQGNIDFCNATYLSERFGTTADRNFCLAYMMNEKQSFEYGKESNEALRIQKIRRREEMKKKKEKMQRESHSSGNRHDGGSIFNARHMSGMRNHYQQQTSPYISPSSSPPLLPQSISQLPFSSQASTQARSPPTRLPASSYNSPAQHPPIPFPISSNHASPQFPSSPTGGAPPFPDMNNGHIHSNVFVEMHNFNNTNYNNDTLNASVNNSIMNHSAHSQANNASFHTQQPGDGTGRQQTHPAGGATVEPEKMPKRRQWRDEDVGKNLELYLQCCAIKTHAEAMAVVAGTLANGGVCPLTEERVFKACDVRNALALMLSCGMGEYSGEWAYKIGLPAKSSVTGAVMVVIPNVGGLCIYSPKVDENCNSVRGVEFCLGLLKRFSFHYFDCVKGIVTSSKTSKSNPCKATDSTFQKQLIQLSYSCARGDLASVRGLLHNGAPIHGRNYDGRTALHVAASEGQLQVVHYLVAHGGADITAVDRWGGTALSDAEREGHASVAKYLKKRHKEIEDAALLLRKQSETVVLYGANGQGTNSMMNGDAKQESGSGLKGAVDLDSDGSVNTSILRDDVDSAGANNLYTRSTNSHQHTPSSSISPSPLFRFHNLSLA